MPDKQKKSYKFKIDETNHEWEEAIITGAQLRALPPGVPDNMDLYLKEPGKPGRLIERDDEVDLSQPGRDKFYTQDASSEAG
jgi:hypothetical protein